MVTVLNRGKLSEGFFFIRDVETRAPFLLPLKKCIGDDIVEPFVSRTHGGTQSHELFPFRCRNARICCRKRLKLCTLINKASFSSKSTNFLSIELTEDSSAETVVQKWLIQNIGSKIEPPPKFCFVFFLPSRRVIFFSCFIQ